MCNSEGYQLKLEWLCEFNHYKVGAMKLHLCETGLQPLIDIMVDTPTMKTTPSSVKVAPTVPSFQKHNCNL